MKVVEFTKDNGMFKFEYDCKHDEIKIFKKCESDKFERVATLKAPNGSINALESSLESTGFKVISYEPGDIQ
jgi:hypothetical protein